MIKSAPLPAPSGGIAPSGPESEADIARRHLPILEANLEKIRAGGAGEESSQVQYHKSQIAKYRAALAAEK